MYPETNPLAKSPEGNLLYPNAHSRCAKHIEEVLGGKRIIAGYEDLIYDSYTSSAFNYAIGVIGERELCFTYILHGETEPTDIILPSNPLFALSTIKRTQIDYALLSEVLLIIALRIQERSTSYTLNEEIQGLMNYILESLNFVRESES